MILLLAGTLSPGALSAHQTPNTLIFLDAGPKKISLELEMPITELELAFGHDISQHPENLLQRYGPQLKEYIQAHIRAYNKRENPWMVEVTGLKMSKGKYVENGLDYWELVAQVALAPNPGDNIRKFTLDYDVIMHQVMNHAAFLKVRSDWAAGKIENDTGEAIAIARNTAENVIYPVQIDLREESWLKGFKSLMALGMDHIKEGTDHLLFLLTLLLPAGLTAMDKKWAKAGSIKYSLLRILKIVTAFTVGHSITLLIGASGMFHFSSRPIEVLIAVSILISAVHAIRPIFYGREVYIAAGFGLIHGMAFAQTLANLNLDGGSMAVSILGFNIGIELMQLLIICITMPWLLILSRKKMYSPIRILGALLAGIAAVAWIVERAFDYPSVITTFIFRASPDLYWIIILLAVLSMGTFIFKKAQNSPDL